MMHADSEEIRQASTEPVQGAHVAGLDYTYKILSAAPPSPLPRALPLSALDAADGYLHTSPRAVLAGTMDRFFGGETRLWLLRIDVDRVRTDGHAPGRVLWDARGFVHIYGEDGFSGGGGTDAPSFARLGEGVVDDVREVQRAEGQTWEHVVQALVDEGWCLDRRQ